MSVDNNCPECGMAPGNCYAICPTQGLAEWEHHHERHVAPFGDDYAREAYGATAGDPYDRHGCEDWNCGGSCQSIGASLPRHPADQLRYVVTAGHAVHFVLRRWVELWAYGKPMPALTDAHVAQVQLDHDPGTDIFDGRATGYLLGLISSADRALDAKRVEINELANDDIPF